MFSKLKKHNKLRPRIILSFTATLMLSVVGVAIVIYFLLSTALRENDHKRMIQQAHYLFSTYDLLGYGKLETEIDPETLLVIKDSEGNILYEKYPSYFDGDFEDQDEAEQVKETIKIINPKLGWYTILLLSGEEDLDIFHRWEYQLRLFVWEKGWDNILPLIDNDMFEVYTFTENNKKIHYGNSSEGREEYLSSIRSISVTVIIPFLLFGFFISFLLAQGIITPIQRLIRVVKKIRKNGLLEQVPITGNGDEIDILSHEFNGLMRQNEHLINQLKNNLDNIAHDIRTPLTRFRMRAEEALTGDKNTISLTSALEKSVEDTNQILGLLSSLMDVAEIETESLPLNKETVDLRTILHRLQDLYETYAEENNVKLNFPQLNKPIMVKVDSTRFIQALANIVDNAIKYSLPNGEVKIHLLESDRCLTIHIEDNGIGIEEKDAPFIWDRLYRSDKSRQSKGMGLGLSLTKAIIKSHNFDISLDLSFTNGSRFVITLPICNA